MLKLKKGYKRCSCCGEILKANLRNFYRNISHKDRLSNECVSCHKEYASEQYQKNRQYYIGYQTLYSQMMKRKNNPLSIKEFVVRVGNLKEQYNIKSNSRSYI